MLVDQSKYSEEENTKIFNSWGVSTKGSNINLSMIYNYAKIEGIEIKPKMNLNQDFSSTISFLNHIKGKLIENTEEKNNLINKLKKYISYAPMKGLYIYLDSDNCYELKEQSKLICLKSTYYIYINTFVKGLKKKKKVSIKQFIDDNIEKFSIEQIIFDPKFDENGKIFNLFRGMQAKYIKDYDIKKIKLILNHVLFVFANNNLDHYDYILNHFAHIMQFPNKRMGTALVFISKEGSGKNIFLDFLCDFVFGEKVSVSISDISKVTEKFNSIIANRLFTVLNECGQVNSSEYNTTWEKMKTLITEKRYDMEKKFSDPISIPNYNNMVFLSNNPNPIKMGGGNRRYSVFKCNDEYKGNNEYFEKLINSLDQNTADILYSYLMDRDLSKFKGNSIILTEAGKDQIRHCLSSINKWLYENCINIEADILNENKMINTSKLYNHYSKFCLSNKCKDLGHIIFSKEIKKIIDYKKIKTNSKESLRVFIFDIEKIKKYFLIEHKLELEEIEEIEVDEEYLDELGATEYIL
jgi:hypothetical protein